MIKIDIVQDIVNPNEELTKDKCIQYIQTIKKTIKETRANVYSLFLGPTAFKYAFFLLLSTFLLTTILKNTFILTLTIIEIVGYLTFAILISEYLSKKLKKSLLLQLNHLQNKLASFK